MARFYGGNGSFRRARRAEEDVDPMSSVANISDAMLVFACGLLIAIVLAWDLDMSAITQVELDDSQQIEDVDEMRDMLESGGSGYIERGTVYQDPNTGTLYLLESDEGIAAPSTGAAKEQ